MDFSIQIKLKSHSTLGFFYILLWLLSIKQRRYNDHQTTAAGQTCAKKKHTHTDVHTVWGWCCVQIDESAICKASARINLILSSLQCWWMDSAWSVPSLHTSTVTLGICPFYMWTKSPANYCFYNQGKWQAGWEREETGKMRDMEALGPLKMEINLTFSDKTLRVNEQDFTRWRKLLR